MFSRHSKCDRKFVFILFHYLCLIGVADAIIQLSKIDDMMKEEGKTLRGVIDVLHLKHKEYADRIQSYISSHSMDRSEITRLAGFLDSCFQIIYILVNIT